jgi:hypothetical protein
MAARAKAVAQPGHAETGVASPQRGDANVDDDLAVKLATPRTPTKAALSTPAPGADLASAPWRGDAMVTEGPSPVSIRMSPRKAPPLKGRYDSSTIAFSDFSCTDCLGHGTFSTVVRAVDVCGRVVAIKCMYVNNDSTSSAEKVHAAEWKILQEIPEHDNVVALLGVIKRKPINQVRLHLCE